MKLFLMDPFKHDVGADRSRIEPYRRLKDILLHFVVLTRQDR